MRVHSGERSGARAPAQGMAWQCFARRGPPPTRMVTMSTIPPRLRPLLDAASPVAAAGAPAHRRGPRVLPGGRHACATRSSIGPSRRRRRRRRPHHRRPPRRRRGDRAAVGRRTCGSRASASAPSAAARTAARSRSPRSAPTSTGPRAASPRSRSPTTSRPTCRAATSRSTRWRCALPEPELVDPFDGAVDLAAQRLRTPLAPEVSFVDDPLRMLRAARFIAQFGLEPDPALVDAVGELRHRLEIVSAERIRDELVEAAARRRPERRACGSSPRPASPTSSCPSSTRCGSSRTRSTRTRTCSRTPSRSCATRAPSCVVRLAALFHDVGKPKTRSFGRRRRELPPPRGGRRAHDRGAAARAALPERRRRRRRASSCTCTCASTPTRWAGPTRRCAATCATPAPLLDDLNHLQRCDCTTRNQNRARRAGAAHGRARGAASPSCASRRSSTPSARRSTAAR